MGNRSPRKNPHSVEKYLCRFPHIYWNFQKPTKNQIKDHMRNWGNKKRKINILAGGGRARPFFLFFWFFCFQFCIWLFFWKIVILMGERYPRNQITKGWVQGVRTEKWVWTGLPWSKRYKNSASWIFFPFRIDWWGPRGPRALKNIKKSSFYKHLLIWSGGYKRVGPGGCGAPPGELKNSPTNAPPPSVGGILHIYVFIYAQKTYSF